MKTSYLILALLAGLPFHQLRAEAHDLGRQGAKTGFPPSGDARQKLWELVPAGLSGASRGAVRGIFNRTLAWDQNQTLTICFLSGTSTARARIVTVAMEWMNYVNLKFDFGDTANPRTCSGKGTEDIKIGFINTGPDSWHWSYIGNDSRNHDQSMNYQDFGGDVMPAYVTPQFFRHKIMHEFGHALGFEHEHQKPELNCEAEFDPVALKKWAASVGWGEEEITTNLRRLTREGREFSPGQDKASIMHYSLTPEILRDGKNNKCWVEENLDLSDVDRNFAKSKYPLANIAVASTRGIGESSGRAASPPHPVDAKQAEAETRAALKSEFKQALKDGNIPEAEAAKLTEKFAVELDKLRDGAKK